VIVTVARGGIIHPSIITPREMAQTLREVTYHIPSKFNLPMDTKSTELYELKKITKISGYYDNNQIIFITKIPLVTEKDLSMYHALSVPIRIPNTNQFLIIKPEIHI